MIAKLHAKATAESKAAAKSLRGRMSDAEAMLWAKLRDGRLDGFAFRRQHPVGRYVADFACPSAALLIEADGGQHCAAADSERDDNLRARGWKVLRFWNNDILQKTDEVLSAILQAAKEGANAKTLRRLSREQNQNHPPPLAGGGKNSRQRIFGGWRSDDDARCVATPRDRAVARSHPPPQAAGGKIFLDFAARLRVVLAGESGVCRATV